MAAKARKLAQPNLIVFFNSVFPGERLSHAVGCAFGICLENKQKRDKSNVSVQYDSQESSFTRSGSFRVGTLTERLADPQVYKPGIIAYSIRFLCIRIFPISDQPNRNSPPLTQSTFRTGSSHQLFLTFFCGSALLFKEFLYTLHFHMSSISYAI